MAPGSLHDCTADFAAAPPRLVAESHYPESLQFLIIKLPKRPDSSFRFVHVHRILTSGRNENLLRRSHGSSDFISPQPRDYPESRNDPSSFELR